jgi:hypothetical protein
MICAPTERAADAYRRHRVGVPRGFGNWAACVSSITARSPPVYARALLDPGYSSRYATYDLRRLRRKQIITLIPGTRRYQLTVTGRAVAVLFTKAHSRILGPGLDLLDPKLPPALAACPFHPRLEGRDTRTRPIHRSRVRPA